MKFKIIHASNTPLSDFVISRPTREGTYPETHAAAIGMGIHGIQGAMGCCGLVTLQHFGYMTSSYIRDGELDKWETKASFLTELYKAMYHRGYLMYVITGTQEATNPAHKWFLELGARRMAEFPNIFHGPSMMGVWLVNIRNAAGRVCDKYGEMYDEPPKGDPPPINNPTDPQPYDYISLPTKGRN